MVEKRRVDADVLVDGTPPVTKASLSVTDEARRRTVERTVFRRNILAGSSFAFEKRQGVEIMKRTAGSLTLEVDEGAAEIL